MAKFFRNTRQKMMIKNNFSKYILYAVGEIVLVVIGILIALSINTWNQKRLDREKETNYLSALIEDAQADLTNIKNVIALSEGRISNLDSLAHNCYTYDVKNNKDPEFIMWYMKCLRHPDFVTQTDRTLSQLKNSGGMRLIEDKTKTDAIIKYAESFDRLHNQQEWVEGGLKDLVNAGVTVFNYKYLPSPNGVFDQEKFIKTARLMETDEKKIVELGNRASILSLITLAYVQFLKQGEEECLQQITILEKKK